MNYNNLSDEDKELFDWLKTFYEQQGMLDIDILKMIHEEIRSLKEEI